MVKTLSELYLEARNAIARQEDLQTAGLYARNLLCHVTGKTPERLIADGKEPVAERDCVAMAQAVNRVLVGEPLPAR